MNLKRVLNKQTRYAAVTIAAVVIAYIAVQILVSAGSISSLIRGQLVPICAYIVMAISLNLTVGILGELSLGHAGFMSVGAFTAAVTCALTKASIPSPGLRLLLAIVLGGILAGIVGFLIGIPVLRLKGDYLAIVTLAFGEIIKGIMNNLYLGFDSNGVQISIVNDSLHLGEGVARPSYRGLDGRFREQQAFHLHRGVHSDRGLPHHRVPFHRQQIRTRGHGRTGQ